MQQNHTVRPLARRLALPLVGLAAVFAVAAAGQQAAANTSDSSKSGEQTQTSVPAAGRVETKDKAPQGEKPMTSESVKDDGDGSTTEVTVNGERLTVPENGSYQRTTQDGNSRTNVNVDNRNQSTRSGDGSSNSSSSEIRVDVRSESSSSSGGG